MKLSEIFGKAKKLFEADANWYVVIKDGKIVGDGHFNWTTDTFKQIERIAAIKLDVIGVRPTEFRKDDGTHLMWPNGDFVVIGNGQMLSKYYQ